MQPTLVWLPALQRPLHGPAGAVVPALQVAGWPVAQPLWLLGLPMVVWPPWRQPLVPRWPVAWLALAPPDPLSDALDHLRRLAAAPKSCWCWTAAAAWTPSRGWGPPIPAAGAGALPTSPRGAAARRLVSASVAGRPQDAIGMVWFSTEALPFLPFTQNATVVQAALAAATVGKGLGDTDIGRPLQPDEALSEAEADALPEQLLQRYLRGIGVPYRVYQADDPQALQDALADVGRLEQHAPRFTDRLPRRDRMPLTLAIALTGLIVADAWQLLQRQRYNAALRDPAADDRPGAACAFIRAQAAARAGRLPEAWSGYQEAEADPHWVVAALYNSGNLHLRAAGAAAQGGAPMAAVVTAAELAKQQNREALRQALPQIGCGARLGLGLFTEYRVLLLQPVEVCANRPDLDAVIARLDGNMS